MTGFALFVTLLGSIWSYTVNVEAQNHFVEEVFFYIKNIVEHNVFTFYRSFLGLSQGCRTSYNTNTVLVSNTITNAKLEWLFTCLQMPLIIQNYAKIII